MKVSELTGIQLDYWVALAAGLTEAQDAQGQIWRGQDGFWIRPSGWMPSTDWAQAGPIMEREQIGFDYTGEDWVSWFDSEGLADNQVHGPTPLIAAMRALVTSKYGDEVPEDHG